MNRAAQFRWIWKPLTFAACATPAVLMLLGVLVALGKLDHGGMDLGADPVKRLIHACGITALLPTGQADPGVIVAETDRGDVADRFIAALARHRHFQRETDPPRV